MSIHVYSNGNSNVIRLYFKMFSCKLFQTYEENIKICTRQNNEKSIYAIQSNIAEPWQIYTSRGNGNSTL